MLNEKFSFSFSLGIGLEVSLRDAVDCCDMVDEGLSEFFLAFSSKMLF
jgi:hypothetical protein